MDLGMEALEMDVVISKDEQVVIAHEPYMPANICTRPDGSSIAESEEKGINLFQMDYAEISQYNCGLKHPRYPEQVDSEVHRPLLQELFEEAEGYSQKIGRSIAYTIELKSAAEFDGLYHPGPSRFVELVLEVIEKHGLAQRCVLQSFDFRILREIREQAPEIRISMLISDKLDLDGSLAELGFTPEIIGPHFELLDADIVSACHQKGMQVVPWTVNEVSDMESMISMGVDGIITDYPDRKALVRG